MGQALKLIEGQTEPTVFVLRIFVHTIVMSRLFKVINAKVVNDIDKPNLVKKFWILIALKLFAGNTEPTVSIVVWMLVDTKVMVKLFKNTTKKKSMALLNWRLLTRSLLLQALKFLEGQPEPTVFHWAKDGCGYKGYIEIDQKYPATEVHGLDKPKFVENF